MVPYSLGIRRWGSWLGEGLLLSGQYHESQNHSNCKIKFYKSIENVVGDTEPSPCCMFKFPLHIAHLGGTVKNGGRLLGRDHLVPCHGPWIFMEKPFIGVLGATTVLLFGRLKTSSKLTPWSSEKNVWASSNEVASSFLLDDMVLLFHGQECLCIIQFKNNPGGNWIVLTARILGECQLVCPRSAISYL